MLLRCLMARKAIGALVLGKEQGGNVCTHWTGRRLEKRVLTRLVHERNGRVLAGGRRERRFAFARWRDRRRGLAGRLRREGKERWLLLGWDCLLVRSEEDG
jgi:hypothetical protein